MKELIASDGYVYAIKTDNSIYGKIITLGKEDSPENWIEIPEPVEVIVAHEVWEYQTNFKIKMNSDRFVAMVSEVNAIIPDVSRNVSMFGITDIYLDVIDDEFRTLVTYFGGEIYDSREN